MHFWSYDITKHGIYKVGHISAILKRYTSGLDRKNNDFFNDALTIFLIESANIFEMVPDIHVVTIIHR